MFDDILIEGAGNTGAGAPKKKTGRGRGTKKAPAKKRVTGTFANGPRSANSSNPTRKALPTKRVAKKKAPVKKVAKKSARA